MTGQVVVDLKEDPNACTGEPGTHCGMGIGRPCE